MIYLINYFFIMICSVYEIYFLKQKKTFILFYILGLYLIIFAGTREFIGYDFESYQLNYELIKAGIEVRLEYIFVKILSIGATYSISLLIIAILGVGLKLFSILKYSTYKFSALLLYYSTFFLNDDMGRVRVGLATSICIFFYKFLIEKKYIRYLCIVILSSMIHSSVLIYILLILFTKINFNKSRLLKILVVSVIISFVDLLHYFEILFIKIPYINKAILLYTTMEKHPKIGITFLYLFHLIFLILLLLNLEELEKKNESFRVIFNSYFLGVIIYYIFNSFRILGTRGSEVLTTNNFLVFPYLLLIKNKLIKNLCVIIIIVYTFGILFNIIKVVEYVDYKSWLF